MDITEIIPDAAFIVSRECEMLYDDAYRICKSEAECAIADGIAFDADMLAGFVWDWMAEGS